MVVTLITSTERTWRTRKCGLMARLSVQDSQDRRNEASKYTSEIRIANSDDGTKPIDGQASREGGAGRRKKNTFHWVLELRVNEATLDCIGFEAGSLLSRRTVIRI